MTTKNIPITLGDEHVLFKVVKFLDHGAKIPAFTRHARLKTPTRLSDNERLIIQKYRYQKGAKKKKSTNSSSSNKDAMEDDEEKKFPTLSLEDRQWQLIDSKHPTFSFAGKPTAGGEQFAMLVLDLNTNEATIVPDVTFYGMRKVLTKTQSNDNDNIKKAPNSSKKQSAFAKLLIDKEKQASEKSSDLVLSTADEIDQDREKDRAGKVKKENRYTGLDYEEVMSDDEEMPELDEGVKAGTDSDEEPEMQEKLELDDEGKRVQILMENEEEEEKETRKQLRKQRREERKAAGESSSDDESSEDDESDDELDPTKYKLSDSDDDDHSTSPEKRKRGLDNTNDDDNMIISNKRAKIVPQELTEDDIRKAILASPEKRLLMKELVVALGDGVAVTDKKKLLSLIRVVATGKKVGGQTYLVVKNT